MESLCIGITLAVFSVEEKTLEEKEILNISDVFLKRSFLSNFKTLVGLLLGRTVFLESNENIKFSISVLSEGLKKGDNRSIFKKI